MNKSTKVLAVFILTIAVSSCGKKSSAPVSDSVTDSSQTYEPGPDLGIHFFEMKEIYSDSFLIKYNDFEILVDGGNQGDAQTVKAGLDKYCTDGVLDMLIATHPHSDHVGGLSQSYVFNNITAITTIVDYGYTYNTSSARNYESNRQSFINNGTDYYPVYNLFNTNEHKPIFNIGEDIFIEFLDTGGYLPVGTVEDGDFNHNSASVAAVLNYKNTKFYFAGDLETAGETYIRNKYPDYFENSYNIYKASHHGSSNTNSLYFVKYVNPKKIFISAAIIEDNRTEKGVIKMQHPHKSTINVFTKRTEDVYWNGTCGNINAVCNGLEVTSVTGEGATVHYYYNGEVVDSQSEKDLPLPKTKWYEQYMKLS